MLEFLLISMGLASFACAQPLFEILAKTPEFLVIRRASASEVLCLTLFVTFAPVLLFALCRLVLFPAKKLVEICGYALFVSLVVLQISSSIPLSSVVGLCGAIVLVRTAAARKFASFLSIASLVFPLIFLTSFFKGSFATSGPTGEGRVTVEGKAHPTFLIIFDEFPLYVLENGHEKINATRFPGFAELAAKSVWFRNASAITSWTERAVPLILSGILPDVERKQLPTLHHYPQNIFTLFSKSHRVEGFEQVTSLCPTHLCPEVIKRDPLLKRLRILIEDAGVIYAHRILPLELRSELPSIEGKWGNFIKHDTGETKRHKNKKGLDIKKDRGDDVSLFRAFLQNIKEQVPILMSDSIAPLYVIHITFPHVPYRYLPDGRRYFLDMDVNNDKEFVTQWDMDAEGASAVALQRFAMQAGVADTLIKELLDTLRAISVLDSSVVLVTADHGSSFMPGEFSRKVSQRNYSDIMSVPLFLHLPGSERRGEINDANVSSLDILPTLLEANGLSSQHALPGRSLFSGSFEDRNEKLFYPLENSTEIFHFPAVLSRKQSLDRYVALYGEGGFDERFYAGSFTSQDLIGAPIETGINRFSDDLNVAIHNQDRFQRFNLQSEYLPIAVNGYVRARKGIELPIKRFTVAIAVAGRIVSIAQTEYPKNGKASFVAILPPHALQSGKNEVQGLVFSE